MNNFSLLGKGGEKKDCFFSLPDRPIGIGTDPNKCSIIYSKTTNNISEFHCQLVPNQNGWSLADYSDKGTWLNGKKMNPFQAYPLKSGDVFYLASLENSFYFSADNLPNSQQVQTQSPGQTQTPNRWSPQNQNNSTTQVQEFGIKEKFLNYKGRLDRKTYIIRGFYLSAINAIIWFLLGLILASLNSISGGALVVMLLLPLLAMAVPGLMLNIRRFHDLDKSGWYNLLSIIPIVNFYPLYLLLVKEGTHGANRFGAEYHYQAPADETQRELEEKYLTFEGRLNRKPYILRLLCLLGSTIVIGFLTAFILTLAGSIQDDTQIVTQIIIMPFIYSFPLLTIRRLHDLNKSGWLYLIFLIPIINLIFLIYLLFAKGTAGVNRFGADPLTLTSAAGR